MNVDIKDFKMSTIHLELLKARKLKKFCYVISRSLTSDIKVAKKLENDLFYNLYLIELKELTEEVKNLLSRVDKRNLFKTWKYHTFYSRGFNSLELYILGLNELSPKEKDTLFSILAEVAAIREKHIANIKAACLFLGVGIKEYFKRSAQN